MGCHFLLQCMKVKSESEVSQSCRTLCNPMDCSPPGSSVHGILQARVLEWVAIPFSKGSSQPSNQTQVSCIAGGFFTFCSREALGGVPLFPYLAVINTHCARHLASEQQGLASAARNSISWSKGSSILSKGVQTLNPDSPVRETSSRGVI